MITKKKKISLHLYLFREDELHIEDTVLATEIKVIVQQIYGTHLCINIYILKKQKKYIKKSETYYPLSLPSIESVLPEFYPSLKARYMILPNDN